MVSRKFIQINTPLLPKFFPEIFKNIPPLRKRD
jgi:hypothetical protein